MCNNYYEHSSVLKVCAICIFFVGKENIPYTMLLDRQDPDNGVNDHSNQIVLDVKCDMIKGNESFHSI